MARGLLQCGRGAGRDCFLTEIVSFLGPIPSLRMLGCVQSLWCGIIEIVINFVVWRLSSTLARKMQAFGKRHERFSSMSNVFKLLSDEEKFTDELYAFITDPNADSRNERAIVSVLHEVAPQVVSVAECMIIDGVDDDPNGGQIRVERPVIGAIDEAIVAVVVQIRLISQIWRDADKCSVLRRSHNGECQEIAWHVHGYERRRRHGVFGRNNG